MVLLTPKKKAFVQTVINKTIPNLMYIETTTIPIRFTTITTAVSYVIVHLKEGDYCPSLMQNLTTFQINQPTSSL